MATIATGTDENNVLYNITHSDASVPELNIPLSGWDQLGWEEKAANARLPYTPSYASFNSPTSNQSALSIPLDDDFDYALVNDNNNQATYVPMSDAAQSFSDSLAFQPGAPAGSFGALGPIHDFSSSSTPYTLLEEHFPGASAAEGNGFSAEDYLTFPESNESSQASSQPLDQNQPYNPNLMFTYQNNRQADADQSPSPASSSGDLDQQRGYHYQMPSNLTRLPDPLSHHQSPMMGNNLTPIGFDEGLANLNFAPPLLSTGQVETDRATATFDASLPVNASNSQSSVTDMSTSTAMQPSLSVSVYEPQPRRPPGLDDFIAGPQASSSSSFAYSAPHGNSSSLAPSHPPFLGHRARSVSHSGTSGVGFSPNIGLHDFFRNANEASTSVAGSTSTQPSWPEPHPYYPALSESGTSGSQVTIDPRSANSLDSTSVTSRPHSPSHEQRPSGATFQSAPTLSITQHSNNNTFQPPASHPLQSSASSSSSSLAPGVWNSPSTLRRNKTTGSMNGFGHRRNAQSEDVRSLSPTWAHSEAQLGRRAALDFDSMGQDYFLRSITKPDGSLAPPSSSKLGTSGSDSLGLGLDGGAAPSIYAQTFGSVDEEDVGGIGAHRGRRRGSSASSLSPYSRPLSMASSPSISRLELATGGIGRSNNGNATGGVVKNAADEADVIPLADVERQHVTTPATELASSKRRKNNAVFTCTVEGCTSTFTRKFNLRGHLRSHKEERPFVCTWDNCGKGFARQHDCKRHEALHLNHRPHTCEGCGKTFARLDALNRHLKSEGGMECRGIAGDGSSPGHQPASLAPSSSSQLLAYPSIPIPPGSYFSNGGSIKADTSSWNRGQYIA